MKEMSGDIIPLYIHVYHNWRSYDIWFLKYKVQQTEIFVILGHFPFNNLENQHFITEKNTWRCYHFTYCSINDDHMVYGSWDTEYNIQSFLSFCHCHLSFSAACAAAKGPRKKNCLFPSDWASKKKSKSGGQKKFFFHIFFIT